MEEKDGCAVEIAYPRWLSLKRAREYCSLCERELRRLVRNGEISASRHSGGRKLFLDRLSIDAYFEKNKVLPKSMSVVAKADMVLTRLKGRG